MKVLLSALLALSFLVATAGAEGHQCPEHDRLPGRAPAHLDGHHGDAPAPEPESHGCTCPQVCGTSPLGSALRQAQLVSIAAVAPSVVASVESSARVALPAIPHLLPFALAPPLPALA